MLLPRHRPPCRSPRPRWWRSGRPHPLRLRVPPDPGPRSRGRSWSRKTACPCTPESPRHRTPQRSTPQRFPRYQTPIPAHHRSRPNSAPYIHPSIVRTPGRDLVIEVAGAEMLLTVNHMALQFRLFVHADIHTILAAWKWHPSGGWTGLGTSPSSTMRLRLLSGSTTGMAERRASV